MVVVLEVTGELFNDRVRRHDSVSVGRSIQCLQLIVLWSFDGIGLMP